jgi:uncharacterized membrane protein
MGKGRLEAFSDGVFSIAITLLIFTVAAPTVTSGLGERLLHLWPSYLAYGGSFLVIRFGLLDEAEQRLPAGHRALAGR